MARRVLILSYYFPPAGGPGVQRVLKFTKYLPEFGWTPLVLTVRQGAYPAEDPSLGDDVPSEARVYRTTSWDPHRLYARLVGRSDDGVAVGSLEGQGHRWTERFAQWVRANLFLPDARVGWVPFAVWRGQQVLAETDVDVILTSGPPHSTHLIGAVLQWYTGVPWVADFRDPWTDINYYHELPHTSWAQRLDATLERMVVHRARAVTTVSPTWRDLLFQKTDRSDARAFWVVQNGYDPDDISPTGTPSDEKFAITHVGSLYTSRNPEGVWRAVRRLRDTGTVPQLCIRLVGTVDPPVHASLRQHGLADITEHVSYVPHTEAVDYMRQAGLLLLSIERFPAASGMMTGKIYEYLASGRPVLGVGPSDGDAATLLHRTDGGTVFGRDDVSEMHHFIQAHYEDWSRGAPQSGASPESLAPYQRKAQTGELAAVLDDAVSS